MKFAKLNFVISASVLFLCAGLLQSCDNDSDNYYNLMQPTALVTVCPQEDQSVVLQLDDATRLNPVNMKKSPFGDKEVRALVNYYPVSGDSESGMQSVNVNWIDSIRTKYPVNIAVETGPFANDPVEIVKDWVTVAEDGYLTLRLRTRWGNYGNIHIVNLLYDADNDPLVFELSHNANGDLSGSMGDVLVAFNLNDIIADMEKPVKITLKWNSFSGDKSAEFLLGTRAVLPTDMQELPRCSRMLD